MRIVLPEVEFEAPDENRLAPRPASLDGKRLGLLDGWGIQHGDGSTGMYPLMQAYQTRLQERFRLADTVWELKDNVSTPVEGEALDDFLRRVDVVINGEAA